MNITTQKEVPTYYPVIEELGIPNPVCSLIRSKAGVSLYRVKSEEKNLILKVFEHPEDTREIQNYRILSKLNIPTLPLLCHTKNAILLPDIAFSDEYRLGEERDLSNPNVAKAIANWYKILHEKGETYLSDCNASKVPMYDESDLVTADNMKFLAEKSDTAGKQLWNLFTEHNTIIRNRINALPRTLTYNDFYWTNLIVSKNGQHAFMFDYNLLGKGIRYADVRNVTSSLSPEAANAFLQEYGNPGSEEQEKADAFLSPLVTLILAYRQETFPSWAKASLEELKNGTILRHLQEWLTFQV